MREATDLSGRPALRPTSRAEARPTADSARARAGRLAIVTALALGLVACNTVRGVGKDIEAGGEAIQKATK